MNTISTEILFSILGILIIVSAFFSGSETALIGLNRYKLKHLKKTGHKGAIVADWLLQRPDKLIGVILIFNNFVNILASAIATVIGLRLFGENGIAYATGFLTLIILIFAEVTPKTFATLHPEKIAFRAAFILKPLLKILFPLVYVINKISNSIISVFNLSHPENTQSLNKEELRSVVNETNDLIPKKHQSMLLNILDLEAVTIEDIMIPRNKISSINIHNDWPSIKMQICQSLHTRLPIVDGDIEKIIGIIHVKNVMELLTRKNDESDEKNKTKLKKLISPPYFIPEGTSLYQQLLKFQKHKRRIGLVVDEYGDIQGMATLEDVLEEIVGEFTTDPSSKLNDEIHQQKDGSYLIKANANVRELNKIMQWDLPTESAKTLNGLVLEYIESIPKVGTSILINSYPIEILKIKNNSIKSVKVFNKIDNGKK